MEMKVIEPMRLNWSWIWMTIKQFKRWFILTAVLLGVISVVLPILFDSEPTGFVLVGLVALFLLSFIMVLTQFRFMHEARAFTYFQSKALSLKSRIHGIILVQAIYSYGFFFLLLAWYYFANTVIWNQWHFWSARWILADVFMTAGFWIAILLLLSALSSTISGSTAGAAFSTLFNFALPVFMLGIVYFILTVANSGSVGFNVSAFIDSIVLTYYRLDLIYHVSAPLMTTVWLLPLTLVGIYALLSWSIAHRANENIGQSFVFRGYKFFVLFTVSMIVPLMFSAGMPNQNFFAKWLAIMLISELTLYVVLSIVEKNMRLNTKSVKLLASFAILVSILIWGTTGVLNVYAKQIPSIDDIEAVLLSPSSMVKVKPDVSMSVFAYDPALAYEGVPVFYSQEAMSAVIDLHEMLIEGAIPWIGANYNIVYYLKDGGKRIFPFSPHFSNDAMEIRLYPRFVDVGNRLMATDELWVMVSPLMFGEDIFKETSAKLDVWEFGHVILDSEKLSEFVELIRSANENFKETYDFWADFYALGISDRYWRDPMIYKYGGRLVTASGEYHEILITEEQSELIEWIENLYR